MVLIRSIVYTISIPRHGKPKSASFIHTYIMKFHRANRFLQCFYTTCFHRNATVTAAALAGLVVMAVIGLSRRCYCAVLEADLPFHGERKSQSAFLSPTTRSDVSKSRIDIGNWCPSIESSFPNQCREQE